MSSTEMVSEASGRATETESAQKAQFFKVADFPPKEYEDYPSGFCSLDNINYFPIESFTGLADDEKKSKDAYKVLEPGLLLASRMIRESWQSYAVFVEQPENFKIDEKTDGPRATSLSKEKVLSTIQEFLPAVVFSRDFEGVSKAKLWLTNERDEIVLNAELLKFLTQNSKDIGSNRRIAVLAAVALFLCHELAHILEFRCGKKGENGDLSTVAPSQEAGIVWEIQTLGGRLYALSEKENDMAATLRGLGLKNASWSYDIMRIGDDYIKKLFQEPHWVDTKAALRPPTDIFASSAMFGEAMTYSKAAEAKKVNSLWAKDAGTFCAGRQVCSGDRKKSGQDIEHTEPAPPVVNVWKKRQEELAKKAPVATPQTAAAPPPAVKSAKKAKEVKKPVVAETEIAEPESEKKKERKDTEEVSSKPAKGSRKPASPETTASAVDLAPPPPVADLVAWPTPDLAQGEFKKDNKDDKEKTIKASTPASRKWVSVPIETPYVSPIQTTKRESTRGRGRGGRENGTGRGASTAQGGDRAERAGPNATAANVEGDRGRQYPATTRGGKTGERGGKRSSSTGAYISRREAKTNGTGEKKDKKDGAEWNGEVPGSAPATTQSERPRRASKNRGDEASFVQDARQFSDGQEKYNGQNYGDRRPQWQYSSGENGQQYPPRERGSERGRGGYRGGRGGYHGQQHYTNGHQNGGYSGSPGAFPGQPTNGVYPHPQQSRGGSYRGGRGGPANYQNPPYRYNPSMPPPPQFMPPYGSPFEYGMMPPAQPVNLDNLITQINYYFSVENLCKDVFLRKHMNGEGYVRLSFIHNFNRVQQQTRDINVLRDACLQSQEIELVMGPDDFYVRKRDGWETWVMKEEDRDPSTRPGQQQAPWSQYSGSSHPAEMSANAEPFYPGAPQMHGYYPQPIDQAHYSIQPHSNLAANAAEFNPLTVQQTNGAEKGGVILQFQPDEMGDDELATMVVVSKKTQGESVTPETSPGKQTNGITNIAEKLQATQLTNGDGPHDEKSVTSKLKKSAKSKTKTDIGWFRAPQAGYTMDPNMMHRSYSEVRSIVAKQRAATGYQRTNDLSTLYKFWSHVLVNNFKLSMYKDFKHVALEDADAGERFGIEELFKYFGRSFRDRHALGYNIMSDFVNLVRADSKHGQKLGMEKLKQIMSSANINRSVKNTIDSLIDDELRMSLQEGRAEAQPNVESYTSLCQ